MKNPSKTSRRSFLKQSSLGVVALANASLFSGLLTQNTKAAEPGRCPYQLTGSVTASGDNYPTKQEASDAAEGAMRNPDKWTEKWLYKNYGYEGCPNLLEPIHADTIKHVEKQAEDGTWGYTFEGTKSITFC